MSQNNAIPPLSRPPPSSQESPNAAGNGHDVVTTDAVVTGNNPDDGDAHSVQQARVHDHTRPFPPPRLPTAHSSSSSSSSSSYSSSSSSSISTTTTPAVVGNPTIGPLPASQPTRTLLTAPLSPLSNTFRSRPRNADAPAESNTRGLLSTDRSPPRSPPRSPIGEVSLTVPRPDGERAINEYVDAPFKHCANQQERRYGAEKRGVGDCPKIDRRHHRQKGSDGSSLAATHRLHASRAQAFRESNATNSTNAVNAANAANAANAVNAAAASSVTGASTNPVTKQPVSFTKEPANSLASSRSYDPAGLSIMCNFCGRCRCESCREPPPLPSKWLCDNKCFCSADTIVDYASCLCCVKGLFYHCTDGNGSNGIDGEAAANCADEPCSCTGNKMASRWACLGALALFMPCLLCYWPFKGCVAVCELCYARHAAQGCRCNPNAIGNAGNRHHPTGSTDLADSRDPEKRLLDPVTPEL